jgi:hypothetical protein
MIALAPETLQCMPDRLSRVPIATLQPASRTPVEVHSAGAIAEDIQRAFDRLGAGIMRAKLVDEGAQFSVIQLGAACFGPWFS